MKVYALVGESGTGKSYNSLKVARDLGVDYILDDGILVHENKIIEGSSAKKEATLVAAIRRAIFYDEDSCNNMKQAIGRHKPSGILILGTSIKMIEKIRNRLGLPDIERLITIEEVSSSEEILKARLTRQSQGKHVIPVPVPEIRKTFSGYFLDPLRVFRKNIHSSSEDKSIVRPSYSYMGDFVINDTVLCSIASYEASRCKGVAKVIRTSLDKREGSVVFNMEMSVFYGTDIPATGQEIVQSVKDSMESYASIYTDSVKLSIRSVTLPE